MSLRVRLSLIISLLFAAGMVFGISVQVSNARQRVAAEVGSSAALTHRLLDAMLPFSDTTLSARGYSLLLDRLQDIEDVRHLDIRVAGQDGSAAALAEDGGEIDAPAWFVRLVRPEPIEFVQSIGGPGGERIIIRTNPADEIEEVWRESRSFMAMLLLVLLVLNGILHFTIGRWLKPVGDIVEGLRDVEQGDFSGQVSRASLPELRMIAEKLNRLTRVLRASQEENDRLTQRSLMIQEEERRHLAQELHDEMGQSISAIKAIAFSIAQRTRDLDAPSAGGATRIGDIANHVRDHVRAMMRRLRPAVLDEQGLVPALQQMVDEWNETHDGAFCRLRLEGSLDGLDDNQQINIYRIVQEALTNSARHAGADKLEVHIYRDEQVHLRIHDNGRGFDPGPPGQGMGLSGMRERVRGLNGQWRLEAAPGQGVRIAVDFPASSASLASGSGV